MNDMARGDIVRHASAINARATFTGIHNTQTTTLCRLDGYTGLANNDVTALWLLYSVRRAWCDAASCAHFLSPSLYRSSLFILLANAA